MVEARGNHLRQLAHIGLSQQNPDFRFFTKLYSSVEKASREHRNNTLGSRAEGIARSEIFEDRGYAVLGSDVSRDIEVEGRAVLNVSRYDALQDAFDSGSGSRVAIIIEGEGSNVELKLEMGKYGFLKIADVVRGVSVNVDRNNVDFDEVGILSVHDNKETGRRESAGVISPSRLRHADKIHARNVAVFLMDLIENSEQYQQL